MASALESYCERIRATLVRAAERERDRLDAELETREAAGLPTTAILGRIDKLDSQLEQYSDDGFLETLARQVRVSSVI